MPRPNLLSLWDDFERFAPDVVAVEQRGYRRETWTYGQLTSGALEAATRLRERGVGPSDRVLLWGPNSFEWMVAFWGCLLTGAVVVALDDASQPDFANRVAADGRVKFAFTRAQTRSALGQLPGLSWEELREKHSALPSVPEQERRRDFAGATVGREHIAEILFTSGTTSEPRGVVLTHGNFLSNLEPVEAGIAPYRRSERWVHPLRFVSVVPLSHVFGQFMGLFVPPLLGAAVVFVNSGQGREILHAIREERATVLVAVPRMLDSVRGALEHEIAAEDRKKAFLEAYSRAKDEPFLRRVWRFRRVHARLGWKFWAFISGGAALGRETEEFFKRLGYAVVQGYGMTETASLITLNHPFRATEGSVGAVLPGREFRLAEDGEILVRGESVSSAYWEKGRLHPTGVGTDGWLSTGDLGELDPLGNLRFRGRKKKVIVTPAGLNVHPEDLEAALRREPAVRDAVVVPVERGDNAEPCAVLLLRTAPGPLGVKDPETPSDVDRAQAAVDAANSSLAEYQRMRRWILWPEADFPRTATGKPRLAPITARATELLRASAPTDLERLAAPNGFASLLENRRLADLSSLDRVELLAALEDRYQIELNETEFANAKTTADLHRLLVEPARSPSDYFYPRWTQRAPMRLVRLLIYYALTWPATLLLAHPVVRGRERLKGVKGPVLFASNHITRRADMGLILFALPTRFRHRLATAMGAETLGEFRRPPDHWPLGKRWLWRLKYVLVVSLFNVFPLPQLSGFRESFRFAGESVDRGYSLLVFPEGIINDRDSPELIPFQAGVGLLARNLDISVVPMRLDGVWQMKQERRRLAHRRELTVHFGAPVRFPPKASPAEIASQIEDLVRAL